MHVRYGYTDPPSWGWRRVLGEAADAMVGLCFVCNYRNLTYSTYPT